MAAVTTLTETTPSGFTLALVRAVADGDLPVRRAAAALIELAEVVSAEPTLGEALVANLTGPDALVRSSIVELLRLLKLGTHQIYGDSLADTDVRARIEAARGAISSNSLDLLCSSAAHDIAREVRAVVAGQRGPQTPRLRRRCVRPSRTQSDTCLVCVRPSYSVSRIGHAARPIKWSGPKWSVWLLCALAMCCRTGGTTAQGKDRE